MTEQTYTLEEVQMILHIEREAWPDKNPVRRFRKVQAALYVEITEEIPPCQSTNK
jgi:hypothetical protein